jgi:hypothetical protein
MTHLAMRLRYPQATNQLCNRRRSHNSPTETVLAAPDQNKMLAPLAHRKHIHAVQRVSRKGAQNRWCHRMPYTVPVTIDINSASRRSRVATILRSLLVGSDTKSSRISSRRLRESTRIWRKYVSNVCNVCRFRAAWGVGHGVAYA